MPFLSWVKSGVFASAFSDLLQMELALIVVNLQHARRVGGVETVSPCVAVPLERRVIQLAGVRAARMRAGQDQTVMSTSTSVHSIPASAVLTPSVTISTARSAASVTLGSNARQITAKV